MNKEKITISEIVDVMAGKSNSSKKHIEEFVKMLLSTIEDVLIDGDIIKIKDLGTFKPQWNEPRKSVDVNTGEEIIIAGYYKVVFIPDNDLKEAVNKPYAHLVPVEQNQNTLPEKEILKKNDETKISIESVKFTSLEPIRIFEEQANQIKGLLNDIASLTDKKEKNDDENKQPTLSIITNTESTEDIETNDDDEIEIDDSGTENEIIIETTSRNTIEAIKIEEQRKIEDQKETSDDFNPYQELLIRKQLKKTDKEERKKRLREEIQKYFSINELNEIREVQQQEIRQEIVLENTENQGNVVNITEKTTEQDTLTEIEPTQISVDNIETENINQEIENILSQEPITYTATEVMREENSQQADEIDTKWDETTEEIDEKLKEKDNEIIEKENINQEIENILSQEPITYTATEVKREENSQQTDEIDTTWNETTEEIDEKLKEKDIAVEEKENEIIEKENINQEIENILSQEPITYTETDVKQEENSQQTDEIATKGDETTEQIDETLNNDENQEQFIDTEEQDVTLDINEQIIVEETAKIDNQISENIEIPNQNNVEKSAEIEQLQPQKIEENLDETNKTDEKIEQTTHTEDEVDYTYIPQKRHKRRIAWYIIIPLLLAGGAFGIWKAFPTVIKPYWDNYFNQNKSTVENTHKVVPQATIVLESPKVEKDTIQAKTDTTSNVNIFEQERDYKEFTTSRVIKQGVTLKSLAKEYLGNDAFWIYIYEANIEVIEDPKNVALGTVVRIPKMNSQLINVNDPKCIPYANKLAAEYLYYDTK